MYHLTEFTDDMQSLLNPFFEVCLPESGRLFNPDGSHKDIEDISGSYDKFWCLFDDDKLIGTVGIKKMSAERCELKSLFLLKDYHGLGLGKNMFHTALDYARKQEYSEVLLDTLASSRKALNMYKNAGFEETEPYKESPFSEVCLRLKL